MHCNTVIRDEKEVPDRAFSKFLYTILSVTQHIVHFCALSEYKLVATKPSRMSFAQMQNLTAGIFSQMIDFNTTSLCINRGLDRDIKPICENITGLWPAIAGALQ